MIESSEVCVCVCVCMLQLDMIVGLLGTPSADDLRTVCEAARVHMKRKSSRPSNLLSLYRLSRDCDHDVVSLLSSIFVYNPVSPASDSLCACLLAPLKKEIMWYLLSVSSGTVRSESKVLLPPTFISCCWSHIPLLQKIPLGFMHNFSSYPADRQTHPETETQPVTS